MKTKHLIFILIWSLSTFSLSGQGSMEMETDTLEKRDLSGNQPSLAKKMIFPMALTGTALLINNSTYEKELQPRINKNLSTNIDDYTRFAPIAGMYLADGLGVQAENHWFDQTKNAAFSLLFTQLITTGLKVNIDKERPNGANNEALPSGHTSLAFASATVFYEEFKNTEPLLAYSGYTFALATAYLRMAKNKHWFSDVILGSAVGMAITKLVYHLDHLFAWNPFLKSERFVFTPSFGSGRSGFYLAIRF
ncbi:phosphatase PAP2 family protein [Flagellimonas flava]|uniref:phosphatase PAP2 family protein n=1 Tax=Flagellimonas flava TaxID=570519 RepID=UPI003D64E35B